MWVNGARAQIFSVYDGDDGEPLLGDPATPFPYSSLAFYKPMNSSTKYLYHQLNATVIAEEIWEEEIGSWRSNNITILTT